MDLANWLQLGSLLLVVAVGLLLWWLIKRRLKGQDGFEGIIEERGKQPIRRKMELEEEIKHLESILGRK